ncbi:MAG: hypothetical protein AB1444_12970 [Spirochaetota bacterium]
MLQNLMMKDIIFKQIYPADTGLLPLSEPVKQNAKWATNIVLRIVEENEKKY